MFSRNTSRIDASRRGCRSCRLCSTTAPAKKTTSVGDAFCVPRARRWLPSPARRVRRSGCPHPHRAVPIQTRRLTRPRRVALRPATATATGRDEPPSTPAENPRPRVAGRTGVRDATEKGTRAHLTSLDLPHGTATTPPAPRPHVRRPAPGFLILSTLSPPARPPCLCPSPSPPPSPFRRSHRLLALASRLTRGIRRLVASEPL